MKKSIFGESLAGIMVGVVILGFTLLGIISILDFNTDITGKYTNSIGKFILNGNANNISKKIDISGVQDNESYYIYKNVANKTFEIFTGTTNEKYKYININGEKIDKDTYPKQKFSRELIKKRDILKHVIYPSEIPNKVFWFDSMNINGSNNSGMNDGDLIPQWNDLFGKGNNAYQNTSNYQPKYIIQGNMAGVQFDGIDDVLLLNKNTLLNNDNICSNQITYNQKSFAIVLKTGLNVVRDQVVFEQGGQATGYNFMIHDGDLYAGIHNKAYVGGYLCFDDSTQERDTGHKYKSVNLGEILADRVYFIMVVQDSTHVLTDGSEDDTNNTLKIYLNGKLASKTNHVDPQPEHHLAGIGAVNERNVRPWDTNTSTNTIESGDSYSSPNSGCDSQCLNFDGLIGEFISWNYALSNNEVSGIQNYFTQKWLGGFGNIEYNTIDINIGEYNQ